ncbi:hypothetical protein DK52_3255 [Brucella abortus]|nr:hypothetical protein DK52_3255 [Brucella abortus]
MAQFSLGWAQTDDSFHKLRSARTNQTGKAKYLATVQTKTCIAHEARHTEVFYFQNSGAVIPACAIGIELGDIAPNHQPRHISRLQRGCQMAGNQLAVTQNSHTVGYLLHFRQPMRNIENRNALGSNITDDFQKGFRLERRERSRRLIEDHEAMRHQQHPCNLHKLALGN